MMYTNMECHGRSSPSSPSTLTTIKAYTACHGTEQKVQPADSQAANLVCFCRMYRMGDNSRQNLTVRQCWMLLEGKLHPSFEAGGCLFVNASFTLAFKFRGSNILQKTLMQPLAGFINRARPTSND